MSFQIPSPGTFVSKSMSRVLLYTSFSFVGSGHGLQIRRLEAILVKFGKLLQLDRSMLALDFGVSFEKTFVRLLEEGVVDGQSQFMVLA